MKVPSIETREKFSTGDKITNAVFLFLLNVTIKMLLTVKPKRWTSAF